MPGDVVLIEKVVQDSLNARIERMNAWLDEEDENAAELRDSYRNFKREICKAAVFKRSGKPIPEKVNLTNAITK